MNQEPTGQDATPERQSQDIETELEQADAAAPPEDEADVELKRIRNTELRDQIALKKTYAKRFYWLLVGQLVVLNFAVIAVGCGLLRFEGHDLKVYITATLAEIISVILVIARHLFPNDSQAPLRGRRRGK